MSVTDTPGNEGSITGTSHTATTAQPQSSGSGILGTILSFWWVFVLLGVGAFALFGMVTTDPVAINPTDKPITFEIDGKTFTAAANTGTVIDIGHGEHKVTMDGKDMGTFNFGWFDEDSVINPTMSEFVIVEVLYGPEVYANKLSNNKITVNGNPYTGPYTLVPKSLYIKKTWDYGAYEQSPASVMTKSDYVIKKELYLAEDFVESYYHDNEEREEESEGGSEEAESTEITVEELKLR